MAFDPSTATLTQPPASQGFDPSTATLSQAPAAQQTTYNPTEGMSLPQIAAAGAGKSVVDTGDTLYQLGASIGHAAGLVSDDKMAQIQKDMADRRQRDQALVDTAAGKYGYAQGLAGQILATPGSVGQLARAGEEAAPIAGAIGNVAGSAGRAIGAAGASVVGAVKSGAQAIAPYTDKIVKLSQLGASLAVIKHYLGSESEGGGSGVGADIHNKLSELHEMVKKAAESGD